MLRRAWHGRMPSLTRTFQTRIVGNHSALDGVAAPFSRVRASSKRRSHQGRGPTRPNEVPVEASRGLVQEPRPHPVPRTRGVAAENGTGPPVQARARGPAEPLSRSRRNRPDPPREASRSAHRGWAARPGSIPTPQARGAPCRRGNTGGRRCREGMRDPSSRSPGSGRSALSG